MWILSLVILLLVKLAHTVHRMDLSNKRKKYVTIDRDTESDQIFAMLDEVNSDEEDDIENLMNDSDTEFVIEETLNDELDSDDEPLSVLIPEANIHVLKDAETGKNVTENQSRVTTTTKAKQVKKIMKQNEISFNWTKKLRPKTKEPCSLEADVQIEHSSGSPTPFDIFSAVTNLQELVKILVEQSNIYAQQNGREFMTNDQEMSAFLGINYIMSINKLPTIKSYWECGQYIGNEGVRNVMSRSRFEDILRNLHFSDNTKADKSDKANKVRPLINLFNESFSSAVSNGDNQSIDEHMVKFKGRSSMKQYVKNKPIKWGFKFWYRCASSTGYLYQLELYLGKKESAEENLGPGVVLKMTEGLENTFCTIFFDNFFNSPSLIVKLYDRKLYGIGTARKDRKGMPNLMQDKKMKRGDFEFQFSDKVGCCKWFDRRSVVMLFSNVDGMTTTSTVPRRQKGSTTKLQVTCPDVIKMYNKGMGGVDLIDQRSAAYHLDRKSSIRFYLRIFFDLMDVACANSFIAYNMLYPNEMTLLDYKIIIATHLIGKYTSRSRAPPDGKTGSKRKFQYQFQQENLPLHLPEFQDCRKRCVYCYKNGLEMKTPVRCSECGVFLCLVKDRNCFTKHHTCR